MFSKSRFFDPISSFFIAITQTDRPNSPRLAKPRGVRPFAGNVALSHEVGREPSLFSKRVSPDPDYVRLRSLGPAALAGGVSVRR